MTRSPWLRGIARAAGVVTALTLAALWLPMVTMAASSFNATRLGPSWGGFTTAWYAQLAQDALDHFGGARVVPLFEALRNSLLIAIAVTALALGLGVPGAWLLHGARGRLARALRATLGVPLVLPDVLLGVSLLITFRTLRLELGFATVVLAHLSFCLPFVLATIEARLAGLDPSLREAALDLGATPARAFLWVILPALAPAVVGAGLLTFALSLDELVVTYFTRGPGSATLPTVMYGMARVGVSPLLHTASTALVVVTATLVVLGFRVAAGRAPALRPVDAPDPP